MRNLTHRVTDSRSRRTSISTLAALLLTASTALTVPLAAQQSSASIVARLRPMLSEPVLAYARDFETANKLAELEERIEDATIMLLIDAADREIQTTRCRTKWDEFSEKRDQETRDEYKQCFDDEFPVLTQRLLSGVSTRDQALNFYRELQRKNADHALGEGTLNSKIAEFEAEKRELEATFPFISSPSLPNGGKRCSSVCIGMAVSPFRRVEVKRGNRWENLNEGDDIYLSDVIRTGPRGRVRIQFADLKETERFKSGPTVVNIGSSSEIQMQKYEFRFKKRAAEEDRTFYENLVDFTKGTIRAFTTNWGSRAAFSVRAGTSLCGIRGTDIEIEHEPLLDETTYRLFTGVVEITAGQERRTLKAGQTVTVTGGVFGPPPGPPS